MKRIFSSFLASVIASTALVLGVPANAVTEADCNRVSFTYSYNVEPYTARAGQAVAIGTNASDPVCAAFTKQYQANVTYGQAGTGEFNFLIFGTDVGTEPCQFDVYVNRKLWVSGQTTYSAGSPPVQQSDVNITKLNRAKLRTLLVVGENELSVTPYCANYPAANNQNLRATLYTPDPSYLDTPGISINKGDIWSLDRKVTVWLSFEGRISQYAISNYSDFRNSQTRVANYKHNDVSWTLLPTDVGLTTKHVYVKYRTFSDADGLIPGAWSDTVYTDTIILDDVGPNVNSVRVAWAQGLWDLNLATGTAQTKLRKLTISANDLATYEEALEFNFAKSATGAKKIDYKTVVTVLLPNKAKKLFIRVQDSNKNWGPWKTVKIG